MIRIQRNDVWMVCLLGVVVMACGAVPALGADDALLEHLATLHDGNLLPNPDFEEADPAFPGRPLGWSGTYNLTDFNQPIWDDQVALSGSRSLRMAAPMLTEASWQSDKVPVKPETTYRFVGYIRTQDVVQEKARFVGTFLVQAYNGERMLFPRPTQAGPSLEGTNDWTRVEFTFKTPRNTDAVQILGVISFSGRAKGNIWFDAVKLEEVAGE